jgi:PAS domain S-box-containing protein
MKRPLALALRGLRHIGLPPDPLGRLRFMLTGFIVGLCLNTALHAALTPEVTMRPLVVAAAALLAVRYVQAFRRGSFSLLGLLPELAALAVVASAMDVSAMRGMLIIACAVHGAYDRIGRLLPAFAGYAAAYTVAGGVADDPSGIVGMIVLGSVMFVLAQSLRDRHEREERYRSLVEHLPLTTYRMTLDSTPRIDYISPQIETMLGYPPGTFEERLDNLVETIHPDDRDTLRADIARVLRTGDDSGSEFRMIAADGRTVTIHHEGAVVHDEQGRPLYLQGYVQDISEHRQLEEQLRIAQKLESVGQLAAGVAHEINTPIQFVGDSVRFVQGASAGLIDLVDSYEAAADPELRGRMAFAREAADVDYLRERLPTAMDRMVEGISRVTEIVRAMSTFAHPGTGDRESIDVNEGLRNTLVVARSQYSQIADVETDFGDIEAVIGNGNELNQVFLNLIVNAAHAIAEANGDGAERGVIRVRTHAADQHAVVAISDTGTGIAEELRQRIFDPFYTTKAVGKGTGQGLAIAHSIVAERHGGTITVDSEPGSGTTFTVRLPLA